MEDNVQYFEVWFRNLESDRRFTIYQCPAEWSEYDLTTAIAEGNNEISQILSIEPTTRPYDNIYVELI